MIITIKIEEGKEGAIGWDIEGAGFCTTAEAAAAKRIHLAIVRELESDPSYKSNETVFKSQKVNRGNKNVH